MNILEKPHHRDQSADGDITLNLEKSNRRIELLEKRHQNAMLLLELEEILAHEMPLDDSKEPITVNPENIRLRAQAEEHVEALLQALAETGFTHKAEHLRRAITTYLIDKVSAQREEIRLRQQVKAKGLPLTPQNLGQELFKELLLDQEPAGEIKLVR